MDTAKWPVLSWPWLCCRCMASGLNLLGMDPFFAIMMWGVILLLVMTINHFLKHRS